MVDWCKQKGLGLIWVPCLNTVFGVASNPKARSMLSVARTTLAKARFFLDRADKAGAIG